MERSIKNGREHKAEKGQSMMVEGSYIGLRYVHFYQKRDLIMVLNRKR
jgi:hypothetical protein